jgi:peptidoglycan/xylan/chitin deacetylase (PgdA/CDA1 family)
VSETRSSRFPRTALLIGVGFALGLSVTLLVLTAACGTSGIRTAASLPKITTLSSSNEVPSNGGENGTTAPTLPPAKVVRHGPTDKKMIALTFDDNYQLATAYATLKVLEEYKVPATFFVIGHYVDLGPELAEAIAKGGFEVGDHTRSHADCTKLSKRGLRIEIGNGTDHYHALTGAPTAPLFRPPGGFIDQKTLEVAGEKGFKYVVMWDIDTNDWRGQTAAQITDNVMGNAHNGAIVLMHVAAKHTAEALPGIITRLRKEGYELVTVSTLLGA